MIDFKPDRLGHCCFLTEQQTEQVSSLGIPVEICPSSNVATLQCSSPLLMTHMKNFYKHKANIVICCDDTLLFNTNLSMELFEFSKAVNLFEK